MNKKAEISGFTLHIFAMVCMLLDHAWATVVPGNLWMNLVGRLAFPIFAFMTAEGFFRTGNLKKYMLRLLLFALVSEIPFNLMNSGSWLDPFHQNVLWTFLIALSFLAWMEKIRRGNRSQIRKCFACLCISLLGILVGTVTLVDYFGAGVMTVFVFYFFRERNLKNMLGQLLCLYVINFVILQNMDIPIRILGYEFFMPTQGAAVLALIPIWLYRGKQGPHNKLIQYGCYAFYPVHILILSLLGLYGT